ncbi:hypothetical protein JB92DRAFT_2826702 [Gautieria morchelliformis]|nr:hypothetical protein JB92DRAFT_2826702 [Gautieria morchelliformis]
MIVISVPSVTSPDISLATPTIVAATYSRTQYLFLEDVGPEEEFGELDDGTAGGVMLGDETLKDADKVDGGVLVGVRVWVQGRRRCGQCPSEAITLADQSILHHLQILIGYAEFGPTIYTASPSEPMLVLAVFKLMHEQSPNPHSRTPNLPSLLQTLNLSKDLCSAGMIEKGQVGDVLSRMLEVGRVEGGSSKNMA